MKKIIAAVVALLLAPLLALIGLASMVQVSQASSRPCEPPSPSAGAARFGTGSAAAAVPGSGCDVGSPMSAAAPISAVSAGCTVPDPSGTGGCVTPTLAAVVAQVQQRFGHLPVSCWSARGGDPYSDHPKGKACDYTMGRIGSYPGPADITRGWALATWLHANAATLHVSYVIWEGRIWSRAHDDEGWRPYTGGGIYSTTGPTNGHYDHVHVSTVD